MLQSFKTVFSEGSFEIEIQKSKFIGHVMPVTTEEDAISFVEKIKKQHYQASHNVPVYLIGADYKIQRYSDDGEPSGTAGVPVLEMLKKEGITDLCLVMTRYFGGVKLGTGGLVRAYTECAKSVIDHVGLIERKAYLEQKVLIDYTLHGKIQNYCMNEQGVIIGDTQFSDVIELTLWILPDAYDGVVSQLIDFSSNQIKMEDPVKIHLTFKNDKILDL